MNRVLVTGAGGPAAIAFLREVADEPVELFAADMDPLAQGLYLVPPNNRVLVPRGDAPEFAARVLDMCRSHRVSILVPTVDAELLPLARAAAEFERAGVRIIGNRARALEICLDKLRLMQQCESVVPVPRSAALDDDFDANAWSYPVFAKPRSGSGGRGCRRINGPEDLMDLPRDGSVLIQEFLPGEEYSVDVLLSEGGCFVVGVPRIRLKVDSGVAVVSKTVLDADLIAHARAAATHVGLAFAANIQFRRDAAGTPRLLEINPRFAGTMSLSSAAGANLHVLALRHALGAPLPTRVPIRELAVVRYLADRFLSAAELDALTSSRSPTAMAV